MLGCSPNAKAEPHVEHQLTHTSASTAAERVSKHARFNGTFVHCPATRDSDLSALRSTLDTIVAKVNVLLRSVVRSNLQTLEEHPLLADAFTLEVTSASIRMDVDSSDGSAHYRVTAPADGTETRVKDWDDEDMTVAFRMVGNKMHQTFCTERGIRKNVSFIDENGDLTLDVTVRPRRVVNEAVVYRLHYCRVRADDGS